MYRCCPSFQHVRVCLCKNPCMQWTNTECTLNAHIVALATHSLAQLIPDNKTGTELNFNIETYWQATGRIEAKQIAVAVCTALHCS